MTTFAVDTSQTDRKRYTFEGRLGVEAEIRRIASKSVHILSTTLGAAQASDAWSFFGLCSDEQIGAFVAAMATRVFTLAGLAGASTPPVYTVYREAGLLFIEFSAPYAFAVEARRQESISCYAFPLSLDDAQTSACWAYFEGLADSDAATFLEGAIARYIELTGPSAPA